MNPRRASQSAIVLLAWSFWTRLAEQLSAGRLQDPVFQPQWSYWERYIAAHCEGQCVSVFIDASPSIRFQDTEQSVTMIASKSPTMRQAVIADVHLSGGKGGARYVERRAECLVTDLCPEMTGISL